MKIYGKNSSNQNIQIRIKKGKIYKIKNCEKKQNFYIIPGFVDTHSHGGYGYDFTEKGVKKTKKFLNKLAYHEGTTSIVGTTITTSQDKLLNAINVNKKIINKKGNYSNLLGFHYEGPFLNVDKKGSHPKKELRIPANIETIENYYKDILNYAKIITIAPELGHENLIKELKEKYKTLKVFVGHSLAKPKNIKGYDAITHFNNAMNKINNKNNELSLFTLKDNNAYIEFINDGVHNSYELAKRIYKEKSKSKLLLVTDSLQIKGLPDGLYDGPNGKINKKNNAAWTSDGVLNGSVYTQINAFKDWINIIGASMEEAIKATSTNAAELLNLNKGKIKKGYDADLLILDKDFNIKKVIINGRKIRLKKW